MKMKWKIAVLDLIWNLEEKYFAEGSLKLVYWYNKFLNITLDIGTGTNWCAAIAKHWYEVKRSNGVLNSRVYSYLFWGELV